MSTTITIQATRSGEVVAERTVATRSGARRSLLAMIDRVCRQHASEVDDCEWMFAERLASKWSADEDFAQTVNPWHRREDGAIRFHALVG